MTTNEMLIKLAELDGCQCCCNTTKNPHNINYACEVHGDNRLPYLTDYNIIIATIKKQSLPTQLHVGEIVCCGDQFYRYIIVDLTPEILAKALLQAKGYV